MPSITLGTGFEGGALGSLPRLPERGLPPPPDLPRGPPLLGLRGRGFGLMISGRSSGSDEDQFSSLSTV